MKRTEGLWNHWERGGYWKKTSLPVSCHRCPWAAAFPVRKPKEADVCHFTSCCCSVKNGLSMEGKNVHSHSDHDTKCLHKTALYKYRMVTGYENKWKLLPLCSAGCSWVRPYHVQLYVFLLDFIRVTLHDSQFRIIIIYLILGLGAVPQFMLCLKWAILAPLPLISKIDHVGQL